MLLVAVGITANTENLGFGNTKVKLDRGHIATNGVCQTTEGNILQSGICRRSVTPIKDNHGGHNY